MSVLSRKFFKEALASLGIFMNSNLTSYFMITPDLGSIHLTERSITDKFNFSRSQMALSNIICVLI